MGSNGSKLSNDKRKTIILEAQKLIARGRGKFPLPEPDASGMNYLQQRAYPILADLEKQLGKNHQDFDKIQNKCEQLAGYLDSPSLETFYGNLFRSEAVAKAREREEAED